MYNHRPAQGENIRPAVDEIFLSAVVVPVHFPHVRQNVGQPVPGGRVESRLLQVLPSGVRPRREKGARQLNSLDIDLAWICLSSRDANAKFMRLLWLVEASEGGFQAPRHR